jgi:hypothetical protein
MLAGGVDGLVEGGMVGVGVGDGDGVARAAGPTEPAAEG